MAKRRSNGLTITILAFTLVGLACGGGGGGGGGGPTEPPPVSNINFTEASPAVGNSLSLSGIDGQTLSLDLVSTSINNLYGVAFDLRYPSNLMNYTGATEGSFLGQDGQATSFQIVEDPAGTLIVGLTRLGDVGPVSGSGTLLTLRFSAAGNGSGGLSFINNDAFNGNGNLKPNVTWIAGSVQVTR